MSTVTLQQLHDRITEIDSLLFKAQTAQVKMADVEYRILKTEADASMEILAEHLAANMGRPLAQVLADREKLRALDWIEMTAKRHLEIFPESVPAHDAVIKAAFDEVGHKSKEEIAAQLHELFGYMFVNHQENSAPVPEKKGFFKRIFGYRS